MSNPTPPTAAMTGLAALKLLAQGGYADTRPLTNAECAAILLERADTIKVLRKLVSHIYSSAEIAKAMEHVKLHAPGSPLQAAAAMLLRVGAA